MLLQSMFYHIIQDNLNNVICKTLSWYNKRTFKLLMYNNIIWIYHVNRLPHMYICWKIEKCVIFLKISLLKYEHRCQNIFNQARSWRKSVFFVLKTILWTAIFLYFLILYLKKVLRSKNKPTMLLIKNGYGTDISLTKRNKTICYFPHFSIFLLYELRQIRLCIRRSQTG